MARRLRGEGSVTKLKDGRWQARITVQQDGKTKRRAFYARTADEARKKMTAALKNKDDNVPVPSDRNNLGDYLVKWLAGKDVRPETRRRYDDSIRLHIVPSLGKKALTKLTPADLNACYAQLRQRGLSGTTIKHAHGVLHTALKDAMRWGLIIRNVTELADPPRRSTPEMSTLTPQEASRLLLAARGETLEAFFITALTTGMRLGEMQALQWRQVDLDRRRLRVTATLAGVKDGQPVLASPKTDKSRREIRLSEMAVAALRPHRTEQREAKLRAGQHWTDNDLVFCNAFGRPLDGNNVRERHLKRLLKKAELPHMRFHDLRHAAASLLLAEGVQVKVISELLGHSDITTTLKVYAHLMPSAQEQAASAMDAMFGARS